MFAFAELLSRSPPPACWPSLFAFALKSQETGPGSPPASWCFLLVFLHMGLSITAYRGRQASQGFEKSCFLKFLDLPLPLLPFTLHLQARGHQSPFLGLKRGSVHGGMGW